jgi:hypothetical protein
MQHPLAKTSNLGVRASIVRCGDPRKWVEYFSQVRAWRAAGRIKRALTVRESAARGNLRLSGFSPAYERLDWAWKSLFRDLYIKLGDARLVAYLHFFARRTVRSRLQFQGCHTLTLFERYCVQYFKRNGLGERRSCDAASLVGK